MFELLEPPLMFDGYRRGRASIGRLVHGCADVADVAWRALTRRATDSMTSPRTRARMSVLPGGGIEHQHASRCGVQCIWLRHANPALMASAPRSTY